MQGPHHVVSKSMKTCLPDAFAFASAASKSWPHVNGAVARGRLRSAADDVVGRAVVGLRHRPIDDGEVDASGRPG